MFGAPTDASLWELPEDRWDQLLTVGLRSHYIASRCAAPDGQTAQRFFVNTSSRGTGCYVFNVPFGMLKTGVDKLARDTARDLRAFGVADVSIWPGFIKTERLFAQHNRLPPAQTNHILDNGASA